MNKKIRVLIRGCQNLSDSTHNSSYNLQKNISSVLLCKPSDSCFPLQSFGCGPHFNYRLKLALSFSPTFLKDFRPVVYLFNSLNMQRIIFFKCLIFCRKAPCYSHEPLPLFYFVLSPDLLSSVAMHVPVLMKPSTLCVAQMEWSFALPVMQDVRQ